MIKRIKIVDFYSTIPLIDINFSSKVNVIIGDNGTFKTKLVQLLNSFYRGNGIETLLEPYYKSLEFHDSTNEVDKVIRIDRFEESENEEYYANIRIENHLDGQIHVFETKYNYTSLFATKWNLEDDIGFMRANKRYYSTENADEINRWLRLYNNAFHYTPVNAYNIQSNSYDPDMTFGEAINKTIAREIVRCEKETSSYSKQFNMDMLTLMFDSALDSGNDENTCINITKKDINSLNRALKKVNLIDTKLKKLINSTLTANIDNLSSDYQISNKMIRRLIELAKGMERELQNIWRRRDSLEEILEKLFYYTDYSFDFDSEEGMIVNRNVNKQNISLRFEDLSSGERQLIGFIVTIIFSNYNTIVIDEPENSLHIEWQEGLIDYFVSANSSIQYILVTHSNHIIKKHYNNKNTLIIDMNKCFKER